MHTETQKGNSYGYTIEDLKSLGTECDFEPILSVTPLN